MCTQVPSAQSALDIHQYVRQKIGVIYIYYFRNITIYAYVSGWVNGVGDVNGWPKCADILSFVYEHQEHPIYTFVSCRIDVQRGVTFNSKIRYVTTATHSLQP